MSINKQDGNDTVNNVEKLTIDGIGDVTIENGDDSVKIGIPDNIKEQGSEAVEKFKRRTLDYVNAGNKNYKKAQDFNSEAENRKIELDKREAELKELQKTLDAQKSGTGKPETSTIPSLKEIFAKKLGKELKTEAELFDAMEDNPSTYMLAQEERQDLAVQNSLSQNNQRFDQNYQANELKSEIRKAGFKIADVEAFKLQNGFTDMSSAYKFFKGSHKVPTSPIDMINKAQNTRKTVSFVDSGDISAKHKKTASDYTVDELNSLSPEENQRLMEELINSG